MSTATNKALYVQNSYISKLGNKQYLIFLAIIDYPTIRSTGLGGQLSYKMIPIVGHPRSFLVLD